nr:hypothetical protein [Tanacetum cinerariifolium]
MIVRRKWLFKKKTDMDGSVHTYKACLVAKGYLFMLNEGTFVWKSVKHNTPMMSSTLAEYIVVSKATMEAIWIRKFIYGLGVVPSNEEHIDMYCENFSAIIIANEPSVQQGSEGLNFYNDSVVILIVCLKGKSPLSVDKEVEIVCILVGKLIAVGSMADLSSLVDSYRGSASCAVVFTLLSSHTGHA